MTPDDPAFVQEVAELADLHPEVPERQIRDALVSAWALLDAIDDDQLRLATAAFVARQRLPRS